MSDQEKLQKMDNIETAAEHFMRAAIRQAELAAGMGEVPVGAVIVRDGEIIAAAHNSVETDRSSSAHAELRALMQAEEVLSAKWLTGCDMYVTLEPCAMCAGALVLARIDRLFIGAADPKAGACGSVLNVASNPALNHRIEVQSGVLGEERGEMLRAFFREMRTVTKVRPRD